LRIRISQLYRSTGRNCQLLPHVGILPELAEFAEAKMALEAARKVL